MICDIGNIAIVHLIANMPIRKRNEYLDVSGSDDDESFGSDHEANADSRTAGLVSRNAKRQKLTTHDSASGDESEADEVSGAPAAVVENKSSIAREPKSPSPDDAPDDSSMTPLPSTKNHKHMSSTSIFKHKPGVVYLSRIPPFMRPSTVKTLLSTHGPISKIFLTPETPTAYLRRKKGGGNKKHSFIDGWVEFERKKHAKQCVDAINGQTVGGKKGGWYRDDVWNAKYLRGFGWGDLMQSVRAEEREREERVRVGTRREGKERGEFLKNIERSKVEETRKQKRLQRESAHPAKEKELLVDKPAEEAASNGGGEGKRKGFERRFRQNEVKGKGGKQTEQPDEVQRVLSKIF